MTTLAASPDPAEVGQTVTLAAKVVAADGSHPAGSVLFEFDDTAIASPVAVDASGMATTTTSFGAVGLQGESAVFTPADGTGYSSSAGSVTETVQAGVVAGIVPITVTVPESGSFTVRWRPAR
jgi:hypothetical protein